MKALVIGGTGPTGPYVVEGLLQRGYQVTILHRGTHEIDYSQPVEHLHGDPHFAANLEETLAGRTFDLAVGLYGRLRLVAEALRGRTPRFISVGGSGVYQIWRTAPHQPEGAPVPIPETAPLHTDANVDKFGYLMMLSEQVVMEQHQQGHYHATHFRYPMIYGPRQLAPREWSIMRRILDGRRHIIIPDGGLALETRGYVENMAHALLLAVDKPQESAGQIYNVADEHSLSLREWITLISRVMDYQWEMVDMPFSVARPCQPYIRGPYHRVLDISKVKGQLGYRDVVPAGEGMARTVRWYLEHRPEPGGEVEKQLGDPFDYEAEDRIIREFREACARIGQIPFAGFHYRHPYPHPKRPEAPLA